MKHKVVLSQRFIEEGIKMLQEKFELVIAEDSPKSLLETMVDNPDTKGLISFLSDDINRQVINAGKELKIISNYAVGYNNIDVEYAVAKGIFITNTPDILTNATADLTWALILASSRRITEGDRFVRGGQFSGWGANLMLGKELTGSRLGIVGLGRIGLATALRARGFGLEVVYYSRKRKPELEARHNLVYVSFEDLIRTSDIVTVHVAYSPELYHLFSKEVFDKMKKDAIFINASRGSLMDEAYLAEKLEKKELFAAGLDVFELEPKVEDKLKKLPNVVMVPHIGSATYKTRLGMARMNIDDLESALTGKIPLNLIRECRQKTVGG